MANVDSAMCIDHDRGGSLRPMSSGRWRFPLADFPCLKHTCLWWCSAIGDAHVSSWCAQIMAYACMAYLMLPVIGRRRFHDANKLQTMLPVVRRLQCWFLGSHTPRLTRTCLGWCPLQLVNVSCHMPHMICGLLRALDYVVRILNKRSRHHFYWDS